MKLKRLNKRGFSLVEVIIAMAVVSIVTFAALSIIYPATDKTVEANAQSNAIYFVADAIECFKATEIKGSVVSDYSEFDEALLFRGGVSIANGCPTQDPDNPVLGNCEGCQKVVILNGSKYKAHMKFTSTMPGKINEITIEVTDSEGNEIVEKVTYTKSPR